LASDWPFAKEAVEKNYRLRAHLTLPEPDGTRNGPCEFNNRLGSPACEDQWDWDGTRDPSAAIVTDEAACQMKWPTDEELASSVERRTHTFNDHLHGLKNPPYMGPDKEARAARGETYLRNEELRGYPWSWRIFANGYNYP